MPQNYLLKRMKQAKDDGLLVCLARRMGEILDALREEGKKVSRARRMRAEEEALALCRNAQ